MKLVLDNAVDFKKSIEAVSVLIDEAELVVSSTGLSLKATDPSHFKLEKEAFKEFSLDSEIRLGLDLDYFSKILSRAKAGEQLVLELSDNNSRLIVNFNGASSRKFSVPLIDISSNELPSPRIEFEANLKLKADVLQDALKDALLISTHVLLGVNDSDFFVKANSSKGELHNITSKGDASLLELSAKKECSSMFPLNYLTDMLKAASSDTIIELDLKSNAPIHLRYAIGKSFIEYFLAPRIES
jgi:proliferating cell nuclear antigen